MRTKKPRSRRCSDGEAFLLAGNGRLGWAACGKGKTNCLLRSVGFSIPPLIKRGDGGIRTRDGGFADPCLNHLATSPEKDSFLLGVPLDLYPYFTTPSNDVKSLFDEVAGYRLRFAQAWLEELNGTALLVLTSAPFEVQHGDRWLTGLRLVSVTAPDGRAVNLKSAFSYAGPGDQEGESPQDRLDFDVTDPEKGAVQPGRYHVKLDGVPVAVQGP